MLDHPTSGGALTTQAGPLFSENPSQESVAMESSGDGGKGGRAATSCTECQRRKQKCSRQWPCDHCQARKISHLCQFGPKTTAVYDGSVGNIHPRPTKKRKAESEEASQASSPNDLASESDTPVTFRALGYHEADGEAQLGPGFHRLVHEQSLGEELADEVRSVLTVIPPRPYLDSLVQHYLEDVNYQYYIIYPPMFLRSYSQWWENRTHGRSLDAAFTCLILRVCAGSTQYLTPDLERKFERELAEKAQSLTERYHRAAQKLSGCIRPGTGGVSQVQQLFLAAHWYKSESLFADSWHALSSSIREAQEIGIHRESLSRNLPEFDREIRRRLWCILYTWDRYMSVMLNRPLIINDKSVQVDVPNLRLEESEAHPDLPSPMAAVTYQYRLATQLYDAFGAESRSLPCSQAVTIKTMVDNWFENLPATFRVENPLTKYDADNPWLLLQRAQLHAIGYLSIIWVLKPFLTKSVDAISRGNSELEHSLRASAVEYSVRMMEASQRLFELVLPHRVKYFMAILAPFDTATLLCSALVHDTTHSLPQREKIIETIGQAMFMIRTLKKLNKTGAIAHTILLQLISNLPLSPLERSLVENSTKMKIISPPPRPPPQQLPQPPPAHASPTTASDILSSGSSSSSTAASSSSTAASSHLSPVFSDTPWALAPGTKWDTPGGTTSAPVAAAAISDMDFGALGAIWDWDALNLGQQFLAAGTGATSPYQVTQMPGEYEYS